MIDWRRAERVSAPPDRVSATPRVTIPITKPVFGPEELRAVQLPLETGWIVQGPYVKEFEDRFAGLHRRRARRGDDLVHDGAASGARGASRGAGR